MAARFRIEPHDRRENGLGPEVRKRLAGRANRHVVDELSDPRAGGNDDRVRFELTRIVDPRLLVQLGAARECAVEERM